MNLLRPSVSVRKVLLCAMLVSLVAAPTPGDIGGCGQEPQSLDAHTFFGNKARIDCQRCSACELNTVACTAACSSSTPIPDHFDEHCHPLVHDGEVCLRALLNASCSDTTSFESNTNPTVPSECAFCPSR